MPTRGWLQRTITAWFSLLIHDRTFSKRGGGLFEGHRYGMVFISFFFTFFSPNNSIIFTLGLQMRSAPLFSTNSCNKSNELVINFEPLVYIQPFQHIYASTALPPMKYQMVYDSSEDRLQTLSPPCSGVLTGMRQRDRKVATFCRSSSVALNGTTRMVGYVSHSL